MNQIRTISLPVDQITADGLAAAPARAAEVGRLPDRLVRQSPEKRADRLSARLEQTSRTFAAEGLSDEDVDKELAAIRSERAGRRI